ncbi:MAG: CHASE2 domain-containing protein [Desulfobacterales bacterium]
MHWYSRRRKRYVIYTGLGLAVLGALTSMAAIGLRWEEGLGLYLLFNIRGKRPAPENVVIVSVDRISARRLDIPSEPEKWPRNLHARLIDTLREKGARVIVFDVFFREPRDPEVDLALIRSVRAAGNIVLCEYLRKDRLPWEMGERRQGGLLDIESAIPPFDRLKSSAVASAPFPLPQKPYRVNQYWLFKPGAGEQPTLPVAAFHVFAKEELAALEALAAGAGSRQVPSSVRFDEPGQLPLEHRIRNLRLIFKRRPELLQAVSSGIGAEDKSASPIRAALKALYASPDSRYLDFYGPAGTLKTIPYYEALSGNPDEPAFSFEGKAVFIGLSEQFRTEQRDDFHTVFSHEEGPGMSGVEIAATAFGNLLEGRNIEPVRPVTHLLIVLSWGFVLGIVCSGLRAPIALTAGLLMSLLYLIGIHHLFSEKGVWAPVVVPLTVQLPVAIGIAMHVAYTWLKEDRQQIRRTIGYFLPEQVVDEFSRPEVDIGRHRQEAYGVCLVTDAAQYSRLSERISPDQLSMLLNRYYKALFKPVREHGGIISDVVGDSMMAIWASPPAESVDRREACLAALEILDSVDRFNLAHHDIQLPTRIGLHAGQMVIGSIGAMDHFEYRAVGDVVNSASRLEGLNKHLGTRILLSGALAKHLDDLPTRYIGRFLPEGKTSPIEVFELCGREIPMTLEVRRLHRQFSEGLDAFEQGRWEAALDAFARCMKFNAGDGPSAFYFKLCQRFIADPPAGPIGAVPLKGK